MGATIKHDEFDAVIDNRNAACLIGRQVQVNYRGHTTGRISEHLGGMRFGILVDGRTITVDMRREEFQLPKAS